MALIGPLTVGTLIKASTHANASSQYGKSITSSTKNSTSNGWYWDTTEIASGKLLKTTNLKQNQFSSTIKVGVKAPCAYTITCNGVSKNGTRGTTTHTFTVSTTGIYQVTSTLTGTGTSRNGGQYTITTTAVVASTQTAAATAHYYYQWIWKSGYGICTYGGTLWQWASGGIYENVCGSSSWYSGINSLGYNNANGAGCYGMNTQNGYTNLNVSLTMQDTNTIPAYSGVSRAFAAFIQYGTTSYVYVLNGWNTLGTKSWVLSPSNPSGSATISGNITSSSSIGFGMASSQEYGLWRLYITQAYLK